MSTVADNDVAAAKLTAASFRMQLDIAVNNGFVDNIQDLLNANPYLNLNFTDQRVSRGPTPLHRACALFEPTKIVRLLLSQPGIDVNAKTEMGQTPFLCACLSHSVAVVEELLKDPRVDVHAADLYGRTPLWWAAFVGSNKILLRLLASGQFQPEHLLCKSEPNPLVPNTSLSTPIQAAISNRDSSHLLMRFYNHPETCRREFRVNLGYKDELAADLFAVVVFLCDDLLQFKPKITSPLPSSNKKIMEQKMARLTSMKVQPKKPMPKAATTVALSSSSSSSSTFKPKTQRHLPAPHEILDCNSDKIHRFFSIAKRLPMDLQAVLCHRVVGSSKSFISGKSVEPALRVLAHKLVQESC